MPWMALWQTKLWYFPDERPRIIGVLQPPQIGRMRTFG